MIVLLLAAGLLAGLGLAGVVAWLLLRQRARTTAASAASATVEHAAAAP
ncbi:hypothetical protein XPN_3697, partial [Xanthomonas arboricola pv. pruni MAFF 301427]